MPWDSPRQDFIAFSRRLEHRVGMAVEALVGGERAGVAGELRVGAAVT